MTQTLPWFPPGTSYARLEERIATAAQAWARTWFGDDRVDVRAHAKADGTPLTSGNVHPCASGAWLIASEGIVAALGREVLQLDGGTGAHDADLPVTEAVGAEAIEGLQHHLVRELELTPSGKASPASTGVAVGPCWTIERPGSRLGLRFVVTEAERDKALRGLLPQRAVELPLATPVEALAPLEIELAAILGSCVVTVAELRTLAPGDVLVFDRALDAHLPLAVNGTRATRGMCSVSRGANTLLLQIIEPLTGTGA